MMVSAVFSMLSSTLIFEETADDDDERTGRILQKRSHELDFLLDKETGVSGQVMSDTLGGGMGAVGGAERVVHVQIAIGSQLLGELGIILLLARIEADVFQKQDVSRLLGFDQGFDFRSNDIRSERHLAAEIFLELLGDRLQAELGDFLPFGSPKMGHDDQARTVVKQIVDGGKSRLDAGVVRHGLAVERHIEIDADQNPLALAIAIPDGIQLHMHSS